MITTCSPERRKQLRAEILKLQCDQRTRLRAWAKRPIHSKRMIEDNIKQNREPLEMSHPENDGMDSWHIRHETEIEVRR